MLWQVVRATGTAHRAGAPLPTLYEAQPQQTEETIMLPRRDEEDYDGIGIPRRDFFWLWLVWLTFTSVIAGALLAIHVWYSARVLF